MKNLGEILCDLQDILHFWRGRAWAWKRLAKRYQRMYAWSMANPGLALAQVVMTINTQAPPESDVAALIGMQACEALGWAFQNYLHEHPEAKNYLEVTLMGADEKPLYVTVQRPGGKTPHQMRVAVNSSAARWKALAKRLYRDRVDICPNCGRECDPTTCWCGDSHPKSYGDGGHSHIPMGCVCGYAEDVARDHYVLKQMLVEARKDRDNFRAERDRLRAELEGLKAQGECRS
jgi:hypothetical protein